MINKKQKYYPVIQKLYDCWRHMIDRCYNPKSERFKTYGARGVIVCDEWRNNYQNFLDWALSNGWEENLRIDKDFLYIEKHGGKTGLIYSPEYCRFITHKENIDRTTRSIYFEYQGQNKTINELSQINGVNRGTLARRLELGVAVEEAIKNNFT